jgi:hypothetical protein
LPASFGFCHICGVRTLIFGLLALSACASTPVLEGPAPAMAPPPPAAPPLSLTQAPPGKLFRDDVTRAVDQGFGVFLQKIKVEANVRDGKFAGWIVRALYPRDFWEGIDLQPGDVVTQVNDKPIERDNQAFDLFQSLKTAPRLRVSYVRDGEARALSFDIIERGAASPVASAKTQRTAN